MGLRFGVGGRGLGFRIDGGLGVRGVPKPYETLNQNQMVCKGLPVHPGTSQEFYNKVFL